MGKLTVFIILFIMICFSSSAIPASEILGSDTCYVDADGDGYGTGEQITCDTGTVSNNLDCNDNPAEQLLNGVSYTGLDFSLEVDDDLGSPYCGDGLDHNCDLAEAGTDGGDDDGDGLSYAFEVSNFQFNPDAGVFPDCDDDIDDDGLTDFDERIVLGTSAEVDDTDGDTVHDYVEVGPGGPSDPLNSDGDSTIDALDTDDDNDGLPTIDEDPNRNGDPTDDDTDKDRLANYLDDDDDGDSIPTADEDLGGDGDPRDDDTDDDKLANYLDDDDDGDSVPTIDEDTSGDGDPTNDDSDLDRVPDYLDDDTPTALMMKDGFERFVKLVFATSGVFNGDLKTAGNGNSGLEGGDNICDSHATAAGLPGTYTAWLSLHRANAQNRVTRSDAPYHLPTVNGTPGIKVADSLADILECEGIFPDIVCLDAPINRDEHGALANHRAWTYTRETGNAHGNKDQEACGAWEDSSPGGTCGSVLSGACGRYGTVGSAESFWTNDSYTRCDGELRLYCFQD